MRLAKLAALILLVGALALQGQRYVPQPDDVEARPAAPSTPALALAEKALARCSAVEDRLASLELRSFSAPGPERADASHQEPTRSLPVAAESPQAGLIDEMLAASADRETRLHRHAAVDGLKSEELLRLADSIGMAGLQALDRAERTGEESWRARWEAEEGRLRELRSHYGDEVYDWLLFASERPNRTVVTRVLRDSPAETAGLREGDLILAYDWERIFSPTDLKASMRDGRAGSTARIEVQRSGERIDLYVPRGPLGIELLWASRAPSS